MLDGCEKLDVVNFKLVPFDLINMSQIYLNTDQLYLYDIHLSVLAGKLSEGLANKNPGKMAHFQWLTTANRILRLYVSTVEASQTLKIIIEYIPYFPGYKSIREISRPNFLGLKTRISRYIRRIS